MVLLKPDTCSDEDGTAYDDKRCKKKTRKRIEKSKRSRRNRAQDTSSDESSASDSESSDVEKKKKLSQRRRRGRPRPTEAKESFSRESESDDEQDRRSGHRHAFNSGSKKTKLKVTEPVSDLGTKAVDYGNFRLAKKRARYDSSLASRTHWIRKS